MGGSRLPVVMSAKSTRPDIKSSRLTLIVLTLVIIDDLDVPRVTMTPSEAYPPLIVDANAVLALPIAAEEFQVVSRWTPKIVQLPGSIDRQKLGSGTTL